MFSPPARGLGLLKYRTYNKRMSVSPSSSARLAGAAAAILLASAPVFVHAAPGAVPPVVVAVQASGSGAIERSFISASVDHLTYALPDTPLVFRYLPLGEIQKLAESRRVDFVLAPPDGYVVLERFFGARSLVSQTTRESSSADSVLGIVVAVNAAKAPDASASVLNGASILVPELDGMPARMLRRELMHAGVERAVPEALRTKTDDPEGAILEAVASGRADAGILPACYVERLSATDPKRLQKTFGHQARHDRPCLADEVQVLLRLLSRLDARLLSAHAARTQRARLGHAAGHAHGRRRLRLAAGRTIRRRARAS